MGFIAHVREESYGPLLPGIRTVCYSSRPKRYIQTPCQHRTNRFFIVIYTPRYRLGGCIRTDNAPKNFSYRATLVHFGAADRGIVVLADAIGAGIFGGRHAWAYARVQRQFDTASGSGEDEASHVDAHLPDGVYSTFSQHTPSSCCAIFPTAYLYIYCLQGIPSWPMLIIHSC